MTLLISLSDFTSYKSISGNINVTKALEPYIGEAQEFDLKPLLGQELYYDLIDDYASSPRLSTYSNLFNGSDWTDNGKTYRHSGLVPVLCYFTYARFIQNSNSHSTPFGERQKNNQHSEPVSERTIDRKFNQARSGALAYWKDVERFLNDHEDTYTLWRSDCPKTKNKTRITDVG